MQLSLFQLPWTAKDLLILEQTLTCIIASSRKQELEIWIQLGENSLLWVLSIQCVLIKNCIQNTQFVSSTQLLAQDHGGHFYIANSIIGPAKAACITGVACLSLPVYIHCLSNPILWRLWRTYVHYI